MSAFLPSEISRLVYGYLSSHCGQNLADEFSESCPSMKECRKMKHRYARNFHTTVQDLTLEMILDQYSKLCSLIFKYVDEDERVHRNVVNLLEKILKKHQRDPSTSISNTRVFKNIQNVPLNRNVCVDQIVKEALGRENRPSAPIQATDISTDEGKNTIGNCHSKEKTAASVQLTNEQMTSVTNCLSSTEAKHVSPRLPEIVPGVNVPQTIDPFLRNTYLDNSLNLLTDHQAGAAKSNTPDVRSDVLTSSNLPSLEHRASILNPNIAKVHVEDVGQSINSHPTSSSGASNHDNRICETYDTSVEEADSRQDEESSSLEEPVTAKRRIVTNNSSTRLKLIEENKRAHKINPSLPSPSKNSSSLLFSHSCSDICTSSSTSSCNYSSTLICADKTSATRENDHKEKRCIDTVNTEKDAVSPSESIKSVSYGYWEEPSSIISDVFKVPTPPPKTSQKMPVNEGKSTSKSTGVPAKKIIEAAPSEERLQVLFENLSKGFKHRPHPYLSPAKSKGLMHGATLSPLSKMYVTPTKPNILNTAALNLSVTSNTTNRSSISSDRRSIFSPISIDSPSTEDISVREEPTKDHTKRKPSFKKASTTEKEISDERKGCLPQKSPVNFVANTKVETKIDKTLTVVKDSFLQTSLDSRPIQSSKKEKTGRKNVPQVFRGDTNKTVKKEKKISKTKDRHLDIVSYPKSIQRSKQEETDRKNVLNVSEGNTQETVPRSIQTSNTKEIFHKMMLQVFVKDTCEIAELDISSEFLIYHRDSTQPVAYSAVDYVNDVP